MSREPENAESHNPLGQHVPDELGLASRLNLLKILSALYSVPLSSVHTHLGSFLNLFRSHRILPLLRLSSQEGTLRRSAQVWCENVEWRNYFPPECDRAHFRSNSAEGGLLLAHGFRAISVHHGRMPTAPCGSRVLETKGKAFYLRTDSKQRTQARTRHRQVKIPYSHQPGTTR